MTTAITKADPKLDRTVAWADENAARFPGADGQPPSVERFDGPKGRGFFVLYDDEPTGTLVAIKWQAGRTSTKVSVQNRGLKCYEVAGVAKLVQAASDFAANLDLYGS